MCIVGDEVGGNSTQKGDGHIGGTLHLCERNFNPQFKTSNKDKRFTLISLTTHTGKALLCCVIFKGKKYCSQMESGIDFTVKVNNNSEIQQEFIENHFEYEKASFEPLTGEGDFSPGGQTYMFKGKVVPCFTRWNKSGGMCSTILKDFLKPLII